MLFTPGTLHRSDEVEVSCGLDGYRKLCGSRNMKAWDWVLGGLCLAWVGAVFFVAEPEPVVDWRVVAALVQAVLSALAIYAAVWMQNQKRQKDRIEAATDNLQLAAHVSSLFEFDASYIVDQALRGRLKKNHAEVDSLGLRKSDELMRSVQLPMLPSEAIHPYLGMLQKADEFTAWLEWHGRSDDGSGSIPPERFKAIYESFFTNRTAFLRIIGFENPVERRPADALGPGTPVVPSEPLSTEV